MMKSLKLAGLCALFLGLFALVSCEKKQEAAQSGETAEQKVYEWKMVTTWPKNFPGLGVGANNLAKNIEEISGGRIKVKVYGAGELVGALEVFDAVSRGTAEIGHSAAYYWKGKSAAAQFFTAVPFGFTAQEMNAWLLYGGGMELWKEVYAKFNLIPGAAGSTGVQMGGWFNKEINSVEDLNGLKMRIPGLGGQVLKRAGGVPVSLPGGEIFSSLQTGAIDATEWVGPYNDKAFGLNKIAKYYYYPGWHEPGSEMEAMINKEKFEALPKDLQAIVRAAIIVSHNDMIAEFTAKNGEALEELINNEGVELRKFPDDVLATLYQYTIEEMDKTAAEDPEFDKVYQSFKTFMSKVSKWHDVSERSYLNERAKLLK